VLRINDRDYRLCGLDTNILSEVSKEPNRNLSSLLQIVPPSDHILAFSPYSLFELRRRDDVYCAFVELFDAYPCVMLKNEEQLFNDEREHYPNPDDVEPVVFGFSALNRERGLNLRELLKVVFEQEEILRRESEWPDLQGELLAQWLAMKGNFPPKGRTYQLPDASRFEREATRQHIALRAPDWVQELRGRRETPKVPAFPSVRMTMLSVFFRLYEPMGRKGVPQDVFDVLISTPSPYLDVVVTESMQASILAKARKVFSAIRHLQVFTIRDLRSHAAS
jgi:hypothetical protein